MLNAVLNDLNNSFYEYTSGVKNYSYTKDISFTSEDTMLGGFTDTFIVGEYVRVTGSRVNDGVYLISAIDTTSITIDTTVDAKIKTEPSTECTITKCYIPSDVVQMIAEIKEFDANLVQGASSESQGSRSVSFADGASWKKAFSPRLSAYRKMRW